MRGSLSIDLRERAVSAYIPEKTTIQEVAKLFKIGTATLSRWLRRRRETGSLLPYKKGGFSSPKISDKDLSIIHNIVEEKPDRILLELCVEYEKRANIKVSTSTMDRALRRANITRKKKLLCLSKG
jgi:transposase